MQIQTTTKYDQFRLIDANRKVDPIHVRKLAASIDRKNMLHLNPIIVNGNMEIIDGQHRLAACRQLGIEVHYLVAGAQVEDDDIQLLNSTNKKWGLMDYINYYIVKKSPNYMELGKVIDSNPNVTPGIILRSSSKMGSAMNYKNGLIDLTYINEVKRVCGWIKQLANIGYSWTFRDRSLFEALKICALERQFHFDILIKQITVNKKKFIKCNTRKQYLGILQDLYNANSKKSEYLIITEPKQNK